MPGLIGEGEGCNGIECCKNIALTGNEGAAERRIEIVFRRHPPGEKFLGLPIGGLTKEALRQGGFDFAGVGDGVVLVESNDAAEIINAGDVVIRNYWLMTCFHLLRPWLQMRSMAGGRNSALNSPS